MSRLISSYLCLVLLITAGVSAQAMSSPTIDAPVLAGDLEPDADGVARHSGLARVYVTDMGSLFVEFAASPAVVDPGEFEVALAIGVDLGDAAALQAIEVDGVLQLVHDDDTLIEPTEDAIFADFGQVELEIAGDGSLIYVVLEQGLYGGQRFETLVQRQDREEQAEPVRKRAPVAKAALPGCNTKRCTITCPDGSVPDCGCAIFFCWCNCGLQSGLSANVLTFAKPMTPVGPGASIF